MGKGAPATMGEGAPDAPVEDKGLSSTPISVYEEVDLTDMELDPDSNEFVHPCPCGDIFVISVKDLLEGSDIARCTDCSLVIRVKATHDQLEAIRRGAR